MSAYGILYIIAVALFCEVLRRVLICSGVAGSEPFQRRWIAVELTTIYGAAMMLAAHALYAAAYKTSPSGLFGGYGFFLLLLIPYLRLRKLPREALLDAVALALPFSMVIAKLACLSSHCCYGKFAKLPWRDEISRHPVPLYDSLVFGLTGICVFVIARSQLLRGRRLLAAIVLMGIGRVLTERFRGDARPMLPIAISLPFLGELSLAMVLAMGGALLALFLLLPLRRLWTFLVPPDEIEAYALRVLKSDAEVQTLLGPTQPSGLATKGPRSWLAFLGMTMGLLLGSIISPVVCVIALAVLVSRAPSESHTIQRLDSLWPWLLLFAVMTASSAMTLIWPQIPIQTVIEYIPGLANIGQEAAETALRGLGYVLCFQSLVCLLLAVAVHARLPQWYRVRRAAGLI